MRNLVTGRAVPQPTPQVTAKPLGPDLGMESELGMQPDLGMEPDLGMGPDKGRAGDSNAGLATVKADGHDGLLPVLVWRCAPSPTERQT